jgi:ABC-type sugar transport system ATPase subunit
MTEQSGPAAGGAVQDNAVLIAEDLSVATGRDPVTVAIHPGEIVGLAGLEGHGQEVFLQALAGLTRPVSGRVVAHDGSGNRVQITDLKTAARCGLAYLPRDRKTQGIFATLSVLDNFAMSTLGRDSRAGIISVRGMLGRFRRAEKRLEIVSPSPRHPITSLSGGNQQKVLLGRALEQGSKVLLLNDPTRGVDAGAKRGFYEIFRTLSREDRVAIVILSTELTELVTLCDRVLAFHAGGVAAEYSRPLTEDALLAAMFGRDWTGTSGSVASAGNQQSGGEAR